MFKKMIMFAASIASRGINNKKTDIETKQLRVLSCFGNNEIIQCPFLRNSTTPGKNYCGRCGCGDKPHTWLIKESEEYSKLDYPVLQCPVKMPGFSNYDPNFFIPEIAHRKHQIENFEPEKLQYIKVTIGSNEQKEKIIDAINNVNRNS
jgi:hypothetical protein